LPSPVRGQFFYLYLIEDIYSRKAVGWEVYEQESGEMAAALLQRSVIRESCLRQPLVLHSDNGAPMKSVTLLNKMYDLGVTPSRGRPRVSNDNPYSESLFRTLKYCPQWPKNGFANLDAARAWVRDFIRWYNHEHRHSRIRFVTPAERHQGKDSDVLAKRHALYQQARERNPERWSGGTRNWQPVGAESGAGRSAATARSLKTVYATTTLKNAAYLGVALCYSRSTLLEGAPNSNSVICFDGENVQVSPEQIIRVDFF
jgi:putative transposase